MLNNSGRFAKRNAPTLLTGVSVVGVVTTAFLTARATYKAAKEIDEVERKALNGEISDEPREKTKEIVKATWLLYVPPVVTGAITIGCIVASNKTSANRTAAAVAAYTLTEKAFSEHREKFIEQFNESKENKLRAAIAQDHLNKTPTPHHLIESAAADRALVEAGDANNEVVVLGPKRVRYFEDYTGRRFLSDRETIERAVNKVNQRLIHENYCSLSYFYELVGLGHTQFSDETGWHVDPLLEVSFFPLIDPDDDQPCIAFSYNYVRPL